MAGAGGEARFAGLSLVQLNELLEDEGQLAAMVQRMEEVSGAWRAGPRRRGRAGPGSGVRGPGKAPVRGAWGPRLGVEPGLGFRGRGGKGGEGWGAEGTVVED